MRAGGPQNPLWEGHCFTESVVGGKLPDFFKRLKRHHQPVLVTVDGQQPGRQLLPGKTGESGLVSRGSQGLRSPLESRRGSLGAP